MNHLRRLIENTEQMPELARGLLREGARGPERLAAYATSEGYPMSAEDIVTTLYGASRTGRRHGARHDREFELAEDETDGIGTEMPGMRSPMLDLFRWYRETIG